MLSDQLRQKIIEVYPRELKKSGTLFVLENVPPKKLKSVTGSYAKIGDNETVIMLYDNTVFGSAKDGFLLTSKRLYGKVMLERADSVEVAEITNLSLDTSVTYPEIFAETGLKTLKLQVNLGKEDIQAKFTFLKNTIELLQGKKLVHVEGASAKNNVTAVESAPQKTVNCSSCGAVGQSGVCEYCGSALE